MSSDQWGELDDIEYEIIDPEEWGYLRQQLRKGIGLSLSEAGAALVTITALWEKIKRLEYELERSLERDR